MEYVRTLTKEFDVGERAELTVENKASSIVVRGNDTRTVRVDVVAHVWGETEDEADDQLGMIERGIRQDGERITVRGPSLLRPHAFMFFSRVPRIDYVITVPFATKASISSRSGRVEVERIRGPLEVVSRSGRVDVRDIDGDVRLMSSSGSTQASAIAGTLVVESRSGGVRLSGVKGDAKVLARSGMLQIEDVRGKLEAQTRSGSTSISEVGGGLRLTIMSGSVRYEGPIRGPFEIDVMSGSVRLALDADSVFFLDAESSSGSVRSDMPVRPKSSAPPKDAPTLRVRARSGSVHITPR